MVGDKMITTEELLDDLYGKYNQTLQEGDITVKMFAERAKTTPDSARRILKRAVADDELIELDPVLVDGKWVSVFRKA